MVREPGHLLLEGGFLMKLSLARIWLGTFAILVIASTTSFADRIQLVQGRRLVKDKLSFTDEVLHDKNESPRYANAPEDIQIYLAFADRPATGFVYLDGKVVGRFDESQQFNSNSADITYGRHTITVAVSTSALLGNALVTVRGGIVREIMQAEGTSTSTAPLLEERVVELERRVHQLEAEIATLKKKRNH